MQTSGFKVGKKNHDSVERETATVLKRQSVAERNEEKTKTGEGGKIKNVRESREVKKKRTKRAGEKRSRGKLRRDREKTKKSQRDNSEYQGRGEKGK